MKKLFWVAVVIAVFAAFFASANPDGLDFISERLGFSDKGQERTAPMADYSLKFLPEGGVSTSLAGVAGILITLAIFWLTAYTLKKGDNKMRKINCLFLVSCILFLAAPAFAARPLVTDDFGTVDPGKFELEVGYNSTTPKIGGGTTNGMVIQLKRGFTSKFDFGVDAPYSMTAPTGSGDTILHAKLKLLEQGENDGLTARVDIKLGGDPSQGLSSGYNDYATMIIYSRGFGDLRTHYNLGYTLVGVTPGAANANTINYSAAAEKEVAKGIDIVTEYYAVSSSGGSTGNLQVGGRWQVTEMIRLDAGYSLALNDNSNNIATVGLTAEF